jgi:adenine deaminase
MATLGGAKAVLREQYIGKLTPGRAADLVLVNLQTMTSPYLSPAINMADAFVCRAKGTDVDTVIIDGEVVMEHRQHLRVDKDEVVAQLREVAVRPPTARDRERAELYGQCRPVCVEFLNQYLDQQFTPHYLLNRLA